MKTIKKFEAAELNKEKLNKLTGGTETPRTKAAAKKHTKMLQILMA